MRTRIVCPVFFDNIDKRKNEYFFWMSHFPKEWKCKNENNENIISHIFCNNFVKWAEYRVRNEKKLNKLRY